MEPLDLTRQPPRSCFEELDGLMLMPRTIDKFRGLLPGGNPGEYFINGKIPGLSGFLLQRLGIEEDVFHGVVQRAADEADVAAWLREHTDASHYPSINETLRRVRPKHAQDPEYFAQLYAPTLALHPELEHILDIIDADDRRIFGALS
ncbi:MAG: DUF5069 domain-containing protein [Candidatus Aquilonibacter sp.]